MECTESVVAVRQMQAYIEDHLHEPITLRNLADAAGYSPWHANRIFKELLQKSPFEYLRARRLTQAAMLLRDGNAFSRKALVLDVALEFVFDSHEGFTRAFSRQFGVTPIDYRRRTPPIPLFLPWPAAPTIPKGKEKDKMTTNTVFAQVIERPARKMLLKRAPSAGDYWTYCEEVGCDVWGVLTSVKEALYEPVGLWLPPAMIAPGTGKYAQGVELPLDYPNEVPEGFDLIDLPPASLMVFQGEPYPDEEFPQAIQQVWDAIDRYKPETYGYVWAEADAPRIQLEPQGYRGYIEARPVRLLRK